VEWIRRIIDIGFAATYLISSTVHILLKLESVIVPIFRRKILITCFLW